MADFFEIKSTAKNHKGVEFISSIEAKKYPIFGTQFHPEDNIFVSKIKLNQFFSFFLILFIFFIFLVKGKANHNIYGVLNT